MYVMYHCWGCLTRYEVIYIYVLYIVGCFESVQGDIDICFVYCWGVLSLRGDIDVCFVYCWGCLICTRSYRCMFCILLGCFIVTG